jgi:hypothetical protein
VEELEVEPVRSQPRRLRDAVLFLEDEHELFAGVEVGALAERQLPRLPGSDSVVDRRCLNAQSLVDVDVDRCIAALGRRRTGDDFENRHGGSVSSRGRTPT